MALTKAGDSAQIEGLSSALARPNIFFHGLSLRIKHSGIFCVPPPPPALPVIYPSIHLVSPLSWLRVRARASLPIHCYIGRRCMALKGREVSAFASLIVVPMHTIEMASRVVGGLIWQLKDLSALVIDGIQVLQHGTARRVRIEARTRGDI